MSKKIEEELSFFRLLMVRTIALLRNATRKGPFSLIRHHNFSQLLEEGWGIP